MNARTREQCFSPKTELHHKTVIGFKPALLCAGTNLNPSKVAQSRLGEWFFVEERKRIYISTVQNKGTDGTHD